MSKNTFKINPGIAVTLTPIIKASDGIYKMRKEYLYLDLKRVEIKSFNNIVFKKEKNLSLYKTNFLINQNNQEKLK